MANFSDEKIQNIWEKASEVNGQNPNEWRQDVCGAWINRELYGKDKEYGWGVDHIYPESKVGNKDLENLRPMHWENKRSKADKYPTYYKLPRSLVYSKK